MSNEEEQRPLQKTLPVYNEACCYGCFKMYPRNELPLWLCQTCVTEREAAAQARDEAKAAEKPVTN